MPLKELNFITGNKNKLIEVQAILGDIVHLKSQPMDLVEIQGRIEDISADKCRRAAEAVRQLKSKILNNKSEIFAGQWSSAGRRHMSLFHIAEGASGPVYVSPDRLMPRDHG